MDAFEYTPLQGRVVFGYGTLARVADEVRLLGCSCAFVLSDAHHANTATRKLLDVLGDCAVGVSTDAAMHTPVDVTERVLGRLSAASPDCLVSLGGGSTTGSARRSRFEPAFHKLPFRRRTPDRNQHRSSVKPNKGERRRCAPTRFFQGPLSTTST